MKLRNVILSVICTLALIFTMCACDNVSISDQLVGEWACEELASDGETDTGFYHLTVSPSGPISLYDAGAGNPGISGKIKEISIDEDNDRYITGTMTIDFNTEDFDPPFCWSDIAETDTLKYKATNDGYLQLEYNDVILSFIMADNDSEAATYTVTPFKAEQNVAYNGMGLRYYLLTENGDDSGIPMLMYGDENLVSYSELPLADYAMCCKDSYILDNGENVYALIQIGYENDWVETCLVELDGENTAVCGDSIPYSVVDELEDEASTWDMVTKVDCFGSYGGVKTFYIAGNRLVTDDEEYTFINDEEFNKSLTVKTEFTAYDDDEKPVELKPGDVIYPKATDWDCFFYFTTEDGTLAYFVFDKAEDNSVEYSVDGIDQYELFEFLPYAG